MHKLVSLFKNKVMKAFAVLCGICLVGSAFAEGESGGTSLPDITIDTAAAAKIGTAITDYIGDILPILLGIIGAGLGLALIFFVVRLFLRGGKAASR